MSTGFYPILTETGITATGTTHIDAYQLTKVNNSITTCPAGAGVLLPSAQPGREINIVNNSGSVLLIYPATGPEWINQQTAGDAYEMNAGAAIKFIGLDTSSWYTMGVLGPQGIQGASVTAGSVQGNTLHITTHNPANNATTDIAVGNVRGPQGDQGIQGIQGIQGVVGPVSSVGITSTDGSVAITGSPITDHGTIDLSVAVLPTDMTGITSISGNPAYSFHLDPSTFVGPGSLSNGNTVISTDPNTSGDNSARGFVFTPNDAGTVFVFHVDAFPYSEGHPRGGIEFGFTTHQTGPMRQANDGMYFSDSAIIGGVGVNRAFQGQSGLHFNAGDTFTFTIYTNHFTLTTNRSDASDFMPDLSGDHNLLDTGLAGGVPMYPFVNVSNAPGAAISLSAGVVGTSDVVINGLDAGGLAIANVLNPTSPQDASTKAYTDSASSAAVSDETTRATAAEGVLTTAVSDETTRATAAEGVLTSAVSAETTRATTAETALAPQSGATGARPGSPVAGQMYLDTDLTKPVWWTGAVWVDATGTTV